MVYLRLWVQRSKMKTRTKTLLVMALIVASVLAVTPVMAAAVDETSPKPEAFVNRAQRVKRIQQSLKAEIQNRLQLVQPEAIELDDLNEDEIDDRISAAENAPAVEDGDTASPLWIARAYGSSWPLGDADVEESNLATPIGTMFAATKVKATEYGVVYDIVWGIVGHNGERVGVKGVAVLGSDGVFVMKLHGEDLDLWAIGRISRARFGVRLAMKGYMSHDGDMYGFHMRGSAHPIGWGWRKPQVQSTDALTPSVSAKNTSAKARETASTS
jgi:hypothetical protein